MGCGSGMTCWRRLRDWQRAGVWHQLHGVLLRRLGEADQIDWSRAPLDSQSVPRAESERLGPHSDILFAFAVHLPIITERTLDYMDGRVL